MDIGRDLVILDFFRNIFQTVDYRGNLDFLEGMVGMITPEMNEYLVKEFNSTRVIEALNR